MIIVFRDRATCDACLQDLTVTDGGVWLYQAPRYDEAGNYIGMKPTNLYQPLVGADGRCAISHGFSEDDIVQMATYWASEIKSGMVEFHESLPPDWAYPNLEET
jgi:hypothetical protein